MEWISTASCCTRLLCSWCSKSPALPEEKLSQCGACKSRMYCNKSCQREDWKAGGHKKHCGKEPPSTQHKPNCPFCWRKPLLTDENIVMMGQVLIGPRTSQLYTVGLNTCIFVVVQTSKCTIAWHSKHEFDQDKVNSIRDTFKKIGTDAYGEFERGFIIPGVDRDKTLSLKPSSRTMRLHGAILDPNESKNFILGLLNSFDWAR